eukprot:gb/GFBE01050272.1/.p1 GENE.gb/GFBE01050272.1/~~gb/GFBE01050272.1/.p1  ORF type:complete len:776 (+),score=152.95 gb/GFBE01050272.1/:1-2328(+)
MSSSGNPVLSPKELAASQRKNLLGPFDFGWLLERVADFGSEDPTWRPPGQFTSWKAQPPPPAMQVLVPEMVLFDSAGKGIPSALFFTDRGGFLRAVRRPLRKEPSVMYDAINQLMRQRQQIDWNLCKDFEAELDAPRGRPCMLETLSSDGKADTLRKPPRTSPSAASGASSSKAGAVKLAINTAHHSRKGNWRIWTSCAGGGLKEERVADADVAQRFGASRDGVTSRWPQGSRLLQACFWTSCSHGYTGATAAELTNYRYDALETEVPGAVHDRLSDIVTNHFERFNFLDGVRDRNKMSALPNLLAQHLAYYCNLELVSGDFSFFRDRRAQLWLAEAKNLYFLPNVNRAAANAQGKGGVAAEALPQKLFRYLSEEQLQLWPVPEKDGPKCQRMFEMMMEDYQGVKQRYGVDGMLRKEHEEMDMNIPVLEGTNFDALAKTFDLSDAAITSDKTKGCSARRRRYHAPSPKKETYIGHGRYFTEEASKAAKKMSKDPERHGGRMKAIIAAGKERRAKEEAENEKAQAIADAKFGARQQEKGEGSAWQMAARVVQAMKPLMPSRACESPEGEPPSATSSPSASRSVSKRTLRRAATRALTNKSLTEKKPERPQPRIEIVSTANADQLLLGAGTGICPEGPTLDLFMGEGHLARIPGEGLTQCRKAAAPTARAVVVPPGAAAVAMARCSERVKEEAAEQAEKLAQERAKLNSPRKSVASVRSGRQVSLTGEPMPSPSIGSSIFAAGNADFSRAVSCASDAARDSASVQAFKRTTVSEIRA